MVPWLLTTILLFGSTPVPDDNPCPELVRNYSRQLISSLSTEERALASTECRQVVGAGFTTGQIAGAMEEVSVVLNALWTGQPEIQRGSFWKVRLSDDAKLQALWVKVSRQASRKGPIQGGDMRQILKAGVSPPDPPIKSLVYMSGGYVTGGGTEGERPYYNGADYEVGIRVGLSRSLYVSGRYLNSGPYTHQIGVIELGTRRSNLAFSLGVAYLDGPTVVQVLPTADLEIGLNRRVYASASFLGGVGHGADWLQMGLGARFDWLDFWIGYAMRPTVVKLRGGFNAEVDVPVWKGFGIRAWGQVGPVAAAGGGLRLEI